MRLTTCFLMWTVCCLLLGCHSLPKAGPADDNDTLAALQQDLTWLGEQVHQAENDLVEYQRLHDLVRSQAKAEAERSQIQFLAAERWKIEHEIALLEHTHPDLKATNDVPRASIDPTVAARYQQLKCEVEAIEDEANQWQAVYVHVVERESELRHLEARCRRLEKAYEKTAQRLHELIMKNMLKSWPKEAQVEK